MRQYLGICVLLTAALTSHAGERRPMQVDDLFRLQRISDPQISADGKWVVYTVGKVDMKANKVISSLWLASSDGAAAPRQLTSSTKSDRHPRWSPDGKSILFESSRSGTSQLWLIGLDEGEPRQLTSISTGASTGLWSRDGKHIAFVSAVWPEYSTRSFRDADALNKKRMDDAEKNPVKARVFTRLFFRHWDEYVEDKRQHLFVAAMNDGKAGEPLDVTPGDRDAYPTSSTFSVGDDFTFDPDGKYLYFTAVPAKDEAWSTNHDICRVPITGGKVENITEKNPAADSAPQFSPDGKWLAYRAQKRAGYEADRWDIMLLPADLKSPPVSLTSKFTGSADSFTWLADSDTIYLAAEDRGKLCYFATRVPGNNGNARLTVINKHSNNALTCSKDGILAFTRDSFTSPNEVMVARQVKEGLQEKNVSQANDKVLAEIDMPRPESVNVPGAGGTPVQMWILKPPAFDAAKKWPLVFLVHGGPQGAWNDGWSFRWNPELWAAQGYVVAMPNPRGSTGFGQQFVDEISADWGGRCFGDLMACLAYLEKQPFIDNKRMASAGASFGGYMMFWFAVNTPKFQTLIAHCGVWNFESMYALTDELWFDEWEHGGPPWGGNRESYEKHSPHRLAGNLAKFRTPMLVIHNDLDFRVPVSEGVQVFTTHQRLGIPSRFVNFPDEGHWVLKPRNSEFWHREVFTWLKKYVASGGK